MDLKGIKKHFAKNREEEIFIGRLLDCAERADRGYPVYTKFLTPHERTLAGEVCRFLHIPIVFDGGYEDAERAVAAFLPEYIDNPRTDPGFPVRLLKIALTGRGFSRELTHRDYLGALMSMEIDRELVGDIAVDKAGAQIFVFSQAIPIFLQDLVKVGNQGVLVTQLALDEFSPTLEKKESKRAFVASMRLDNLVAEGFGISRAKAVEKIAAGNVTLRHEECLKPAALVREGDMIALRGYGRITVGQTGGVSRKGRISLEIIQWR